MNPSRICAYLAALAAFTTALARAEVPTKPTINLALAKQVVAQAEAEAIKHHWTVVIVIVDEGGNLVLMERMDATQLGSLEVAQGKAVTALRFKRPSKAFEDLIVNGRNAILSLPGVVAIEGGAPLLVNGVPVGAIGVSGMKSTEDGVVMQAGVAAFEQLAK